MSNSSEFTIACVKTNSIDELRECLKLRAADPVDCKTWGITPTEWRNSIKRALELLTTTGANLEKT